MKSFKPLIIIFIFLLTGCVEKQILDDINILTGIGYDLTEENEVMGTVLIPIYEADQTINNETITDISERNKDLVSTVQKKATDPIVLGSIENVIFHRDLAEQGIIQFIDGLQRDASVGTSLYIMVSEDPTVDILSGNYGNRSTASYITNLLEHNMKRRDLPRTNLHVFLNDYYQEGKDPNLPIIGLSDGKLGITGVGILKKDKLASTIELRDLFFFKLLADHYTEGIFVLDLPDGESVSIMSIRSRKKINIDWNGDVPQINIKLKLNGALRDYTGAKVDDKLIATIQETFEGVLRTECLNLIKRFQEEEIDPFGYGFEVKTRKRGFDIKKWEDQYPDIPVTVNADVTIIERGVID
ncbi:Ger(x)C family spore germination protein [Sutcliffiella cohnii]|uniref:Ger(x)C family spore germination protein n=1 Tax=Sutcliffiella cohnii TaxID=33932 RepID=UPI002E1A7BFD|nr:Ger(x)C family spore germination protein [Sutcliffiella cohnii]MED4014979.1 Ger(x)C family spore germination protein [Sutcliffiella cohnii]